MFVGSRHLLSWHPSTGVRVPMQRMLDNKTAWIALGLLSISWLGAQDSPPARANTPKLGLEQIITNLDRRNAQRAASLEGFEGKRIYRMQYRGFPSDRDGEIVVKVSFHAPNSKEFTILSETGSRFVVDHILKKLLDAEEEAAKGDNRDMALTHENYDFALAGYDVTPTGGQYVLNLMPKKKNKFLYRGTIWVDATDFAVVRIQGEPGKNPSLWIKKTSIDHRYAKVDGLWLPAENHTESSIRLGGQAMLSIEYQDYKIAKTPSISAEKSRRGNSGSDVIHPDVTAAWASHISGANPR